MTRDPAAAASVFCSVVIPAHDEAENVEPLFAELLPVLEKLGRPWEVILVDDGSADGTGAAVERARRGRREVRLLRLEPGAGQSFAMISGARAARGEAVVMLDADLQNDPADIPRLLEKFGEYDVVSGWRERRRDDWRRRLASRIANAVRRFFLKDGVRDVGCTLKVYRRELLLKVPAFDGMHRFLPALCLMQGARLAELPVNHRPRTRGRAKYGILRRLRRVLPDLRGVRWLRRRARVFAAREVPPGGAGTPPGAGAGRPA